MPHAPYGQSAFWLSYLGGELDSIGSHPVRAGMSCPPAWCPLGTVRCRVEGPGAASGTGAERRRRSRAADASTAWPRSRMLPATWRAPVGLTRA